MTKNKSYLEPEVNIISLCLEGSVLVGSGTDTDLSTGEDITFGDQFDPWN